MQTFGKLVGIKGNQVTLNIDEELDINKLARWSAGKQAVVGVEFNDGRTRTMDQLRKAWALIRDVANWSGYTPFEAEQEMKVEYMTQTGKPMFSQHDCSIDVEREFIQVIVDFCFDWDVPFKTKTWDMISNNYHAVYEATIHRRCVICGAEHADIDHFYPIGMGRNRKTLKNKDQFYYWALCRKDHQTKHQMGELAFANAHHMKPVKLSDDDIKKLGI